MQRTLNDESHRLAVWSLCPICHEKVEYAAMDCCPKQEAKSGSFPIKSVPVLRLMESDPLRVLIIDDEKAHAEAVAESLARVGYECVIATSGKAGADKIEKEDFDVILTDLRMQDLDGLALLRKAKQDLPEAEVVLITGYGDVKTAVEAIKEGASNYLTKPVDMGELRAIVDKAGERLRLAPANRELQRQLDGEFRFEGLVAHNTKIHSI